KIGSVTVELKNAQLINTEAIEQIRERPNRPVNMSFALMDGRAVFRFEKYMQELARDKESIVKKVASFKESLSKKYREPEELINSIDLPLIGEPQAGGATFPANKPSPTIQSQIESALDATFATIASQKIGIPRPDEVRAYLLEHLEIPELLLYICESARSVF